MTPPLTSRTRLIAACVSMLGAAIPFFFVELPPLMDLGQHAEQTRRILELLGVWSPTSSDANQLALLFGGPNVLPYFVLVPLALVEPLLAAARHGAMVIVVCWVAALHVFAWARGRSPWGAMLASFLAYSPALTWGFLNFLSGFPFLLLAYDTATQTRRPFDRGQLALLTLALVGCYFGHVLLLVPLALALSIALVASPALRPRVRSWLLATTPVFVMGAAYAPSAIRARAASGFEAAYAYYEGTYPARFFAKSFARQAFASELGAMPAGLFMVSIAYATYALTRHLVFSREQTEPSDVDWPLAPLLAGLLVVVLGAPNVLFGTVQLPDRFVPCAIAVALLMLPRASFHPRLALAALGSAAFAVGIAHGDAWASFEQNQLSGFYESLAAIRSTHRPARVIGVDLMGPSPEVPGRPYMQLFIWPVALFGGDANFSFAEHHTCAVGYRTPRHRTWTPGLEIYPNRLGARDLEAFEFAFVSATPSLHAQFQRVTGAAPLVREGVVRVYQLRDVRAEPTRPAQEGPRGTQ